MDDLKSDGDDTDYIHQSVNEEYQYKETGKSVSGCLSLKSSDEKEEGFAATLQQVFFETTPLILIPAVTGSREKPGLSERKLNVSWAENVYDTPPSIVSHTKGKKQKKHEEQRNRQEERS
ncbi:PREDICTED: uncharacterized protein LOC104824529 [Tarenaya hassleriana]|uniref:uncharacterized protein LOC104824529 n=1 Tax=Tarenaya hassleriana TaxID=28532 RepID=UPI00053C294A|nr:PREDICTED: uncharacterized protein LOC104824529 [Tarenaya hassleriana]